MVSEVSRLLNVNSQPDPASFPAASCKNMKCALLITVPVFTILSSGFLHVKGEIPVKELTHLLGEEKPGPDGALAISNAPLARNETAYVTCELWGSVGIDCEYEISDEQILSFMKSEVKYRFPERMKPGWTGGDAAQKGLFFKAKQPGSVILKIHRMFRGHKEEMRSIRIIVKSSDAEK
jgi:hypothetical protein